MNIHEALDLFWTAVQGSSLRRVAREARVSHSTAIRWTDGVLPEGENREKVIAWAVAYRSPELVLRRAFEATGHNVARLSEIRGYAAAVLSMLRSVTADQEKVVDSLTPYVEAEGRVLAAEVPAEAADQIRESVRRNAAQATNTPPTQASGGQ
jgi:hypothetical protein